MDLSHIPLATYRSHKIVRAAKIIGIEPSTDPGGFEGLILVFEQKDQTLARAFVQHAELEHKPRPEQGRWLIVYSDGHFSFSPPDAFEQGYLPVADDVGTLQLVCGETIQLVRSPDDGSMVSGFGGVLKLHHAIPRGKGEGDEKVLARLKAWFDEHMAAWMAVDENPKRSLNKLLARVVELEDLLTSARVIAYRRGADTDWDVFDKRVATAGIGSVTAKVFMVPPEVETVARGPFIPPTTANGDCEGRMFDGPDQLPLSSITVIEHDYGARIGLGFAFGSAAHARCAAAFKRGMNQRDTARLLHRLADAVDAGEFVLGDDILLGRELHLDSPPVPARPAASGNVLPDFGKLEVERFVAGKTGAVLPPADPA